MGLARHDTKHGWHGKKVARHGTVGTFDTSTENEEREDHDHTLTLFYSFPKEDQLDLILICDVCHCPIAKTSWVYYCKLCRYGTHLDCVVSEDGPNEE